MLPTSHAASNLVILSSFKGFTTHVRELCSRTGEQVIVEEAYGDDAIPVAKAYESKGYEVLLARRFTARCIEGAVKIPLVILDISAFDLYQNLVDQLPKMNYPKHIGYLGYSQEAMLYNLPSMEQMLGLKISPLLIDSMQDVAQQVPRALDQKVEAIFTTGTCMANVCRRFGLPVGVIYPRTNTLLQGIRQARELIKQRKENEYGRRLWAVMNTVSDGVLVTDSQDRISMINVAAEEILGISASAVLGETLSSLGSLLGISRLLDRRANGQEERIAFKARKLAIKKVRLETDTAECAVVTLCDVTRERRPEEAVRKALAGKGLAAKISFDRIIGQSPCFLAAVEQARRFARSDFTVLILGESGTGKELFAQSIHNESGLKEGPFVAVNCAAFPETLLESELFGYDQGAFTGADRRGKPGLFELAHGGTIFLDEIGDLSLSVQAKLLRVLQEKEVRRINGDRVIAIEVRVIAATNRNLADDVEKGHFRRDLFYRLNVLTLKIPPLRQRPEDIAELANHFVAHYSKQLDRQMDLLTNSVAAALTRCHWPGNVRELENFIKKYVLLFDGPQSAQRLFKEMLDENLIWDEQPLEREPVRLDLIGSTVPSVEPALESDLLLLSRLVAKHHEASGLSPIELGQLATLVDRCHIDKSQVARLLGISRTTLWKKLKESAG